MSITDKRITVRLSAETEQALRERATPTNGGPAVSEAAETALSRYWALLAASRRSLQEQFSGLELCLIADAMNGTLVYASDLGAAFIGVEDAIYGDGLDQKWGVDGPALLQKIYHLSLVEIAALLDAVELFWERVGRGEEAAPENLLAMAMEAAKGG